MPVPGSKPQFEIRAKVRIGEKKQTSGGKEYPSATDHFRSDDPLFAQLAGDKPKTIRITFPHVSAADNFSSGLEMWLGAMLACYTKGEPAADPIAYRKQEIKRGSQTSSLVLADDIKRGEPMGNDRLPVTCRARECPFFKRKECRPMARLLFFVEGSDAVWELDTKAFNSIERLEAAFSIAMAKDRDLRGRTFELSVEIKQKGRDKFPVLNLKEAGVLVQTDADMAKVSAVQVAERLTALNSEPRVILAGVLDELRPGWREDERYVARIKEVGVEKALEGTLAQLNRVVQ